jgi:hypothetical protein
MDIHHSLASTSLGLRSLLESLEDKLDRTEDPNLTDHDSSPDGCDDSCTACAKAQRLESHILMLEDALEVVEIYMTAKPK